MSAWRLNWSWRIKGDQHLEGEADNGDKGAAQVQEKENRDEGHNVFLTDGLQGVDGAIDEAGTVIGRLQHPGNPVLKARSTSR